MELQTVSGVSYTANSLGSPQQDAIQDHTHSDESGSYLNNGVNSGGSR
jgi:hypothetical protein